MTSQSEAAMVTGNGPVSPPRLRRMSIRARLLGLTGFLLAILVGTSLSLTHSMQRSSAAVEHAERVTAMIDLVTETRGAFDDLRYWQADLSVSLLTNSERNARAALARLSGALDRLAGDERAATLRAEILAYDDGARKAVEAYTDNQRVVGNALFGQARIHALAAEESLASWHDELEQEARAAHLQVIERAGEAVRIMTLVLTGSVLLGLVLALVTLRSILQPLHALIEAVKSITAGTPHVVLPPDRTDELGPMTHALRLLRESQVQLKTAREEAERATRAKGEFLANMNHELRTPLNAIIGFTEILIEDAVDDGATDRRDDLRRIDRAGRHLLAVINSILDLSKLEAGRMEVFIEPVDLEELVDTVRMLVEGQVQANGNRLTVRRPDEIGTVLTDAIKLRQCLLNLLSNAAKFTRNGDIWLEVELSPDGSDGAAHRLRFVVADSGIGMTEEQLGRLFQAFMQAESSTTRQYGGTGLGLSITRSFARLLGGDVTVTSELGAGTRFVLDVPVELTRLGMPDLLSPVGER